MKASKRLSDRSLAILDYIWKWKLTTTAQIAAVYFPNRSIQASYNTLWRLKKGGFVQTQSDRAGRILVWTLTRKGFEVVRSRLPSNLKSEGYLSETPVHDLIVQAVHMGPWGGQLPPGSETYTEQQLRCIDKDLYPDWIPKSELRRPDGYWRIVDPEKTNVIALEVELTRKDPSDYMRVKRFYDMYPMVDQVFWVVAKEHQIATIVDKVVGQSPSTSKHCIVRLSQFAELGWNAPVAVGPNQGQMAHLLLSKKYQKSVKTFSSCPAIDARRFPIKPRTSQECFSALLGD
jgi:hypothetical protein